MEAPPGLESPVCAVAELGFSLPLDCVQTEGVIGAVRTLFTHLFKCTENVARKIVSDFGVRSLSLIFLPARATLWSRYYILVAWSWRNQASKSKDESGAIAEVVFW